MQFIQQPQQQAQAQPQLPAGWQLAYTPEGVPYYVDHTTRTTQWHPPTAPAAGYGGGAPRQQYGGGMRGGGAGGVRGGIDHGKRKTKMCMNWENGNCSWGERCAFAHGPVELVPNARAQQGGQPQQQGQAPMQQQQQAVPAEAQPQAVPQQQQQMQQVPPTQQPMPTAVQQ